ncbi:alpha-N-acetylglucosaminidase TIM-barrel domain-containing protein [Lentibacillus sp.]|uniref:alpha-N-acetylglucosaminidase TIM-barrel domain-containing protein n=1 Tax=Lentibacillus sp. TaxID=1925746 RepID=UPI002B4ACDBF|nr:alpha-N-acetylglucosaminidase TIM-barrel domain-containing protein [Lentibacillus sp.]HLS08300.1 alpha-N-acetylglucosaminidase TIM-barrel domain-containing protein [Lentibacillus sp.]
MRKNKYLLCQLIVTMMAVLLLFSVAPKSADADFKSSGDDNHQFSELQNQTIKPCTGPPDNQGNNNHFENSSVDLNAASNLIERWLPCKQARQFKLGVLDTSGYDQETFQIEPGPGQHITISGSSTSALLMGWKWYLKYVVHANISLTGKQLDLPKKLPLPDQIIQRDANVENRFALNDTDEGYTDPYEDWDYWQHKIDVLAMHGINEVLVYPGTEAVYQKTFEEFGYSTAEMRDWIPTPAHQPWWLLQNLSGFPGPIPQNVIDKRAELGRKIADGLRELGMTPVFPGYYGMVPFNFEEKNPGANIVPQGTYHRFTQPDWLDPTNEWFPKVAKAFYKHQSELLGDSSMYKMDLLHEGGQAGNVDIGDASIAVQEALEKAHPKATWAILGWHSNPLPETIEAIDKDKMLILDGISERSSAKNREDDWDQTPYAFGTIWNFGGHTNMGANITVWNEKFFKWLNKEDSKLKGTALMPEAIDNNPAAMEFFTEMAWHDEPVDMNEWFAQYATARYGAVDEHAQTAWQTISQTVYDLPANNSSEKATEMYSLEPSLTAPTTGIHFQKDLHYDKAEFERALTELLKVDPSLRDSSAYQFDLMDVTRQFLANKGRNLFPKIKSAYNRGDKSAFDELSAKWLDYMKLTDKVAATNKHSMIGPWLENAKSWATNEKERKRLEYDARSLISIWGTPGLDDYGRRQWSGLVGDYYYSRWQKYFESLDKTLETGQPPESIDWFEYGQEWAHQNNNYPTEPSGDIIKIAKGIHEKFAGEPEGKLEISSSKEIINSGDKETTISATFTNQNGVTKANNLKLKLNVPEGYSAEAQTPDSTQEIDPGETFKVKWRVTAPEDRSGQAAAKFVVDASFENGHQIDNITDETRLLVENDVQTPYKTISFNDATFSQAEDNFAIYGGGNDMWKSKDYYGAIYQENAFGSTDTVTTKVDHQDRTGPYARAGIVARNDLTNQNDSAGYINISVTPDHGCMLSWDSNGDGTLDSKKNATEFNGPEYVRLSRNGSLFTASCSPDGEHWKEVGTVFVPDTNEDVDTGVFMSAVNGSGDSTGLAQFKGFSIEPQEFLLQLPHRKIPGGVPINVTALFQNKQEQSIKDMAAVLDVPNDWEVKAITPADRIELAPNEKVKVTWNVIAPEDADPADINLRATANYTLDGNEHAVKSKLPVEVISTADNLSAAFNNVGITDDDNPGPGNLDGGNSFSAQALTKEGLTPGATVTHKGVSFKWPDVPAGTPDNVKGQSAIQASTAGDKLAFIGAGVYDQTGSGAVVYSDGTVQEFSVHFDNYASPDPSAESVVARFEYRNTPSGPANFGHNYQVLYDEVTLYPDKTVEAVILPDNSRIHVFSMTFVNSESTESSVEAMKSLVDQYKADGEITSSQVARLMNLQLTSISHFADKDAIDKAVKHMNGFKQLLDHNEENGQIIEDAADKLRKHADNLLEKW